MSPGYPTKIYTQKFARTVFHFSQEIKKVPTYKLQYRSKRSPQSHMICSIPTLNFNLFLTNLGFSIVRDYYFLGKDKEISLTDIVTTSTMLN